MSTAFGQSLGDIARKEKKRRDANERAGAKVRVITEAEVRRAPSAAAKGDVAVEGGDLSGREPDSSESEAGRLAPDFSLPDRSGRVFSLRDFRGRPLLVDFWATWCGPCKATMPEIERLHQEYGRDLQVVGLNIEGKAPNVLGYLDEAGYSFRVLFDSGNWDSVTADSYGVTSIPRTFLIDRDGRIVFEGHPQSLTDDQIAAVLR